MFRIVEFRDKNQLLKRHGISTMKNWRMIYIALLTIVVSSNTVADQNTDSGFYLSGGIGQNWIRSGIPEENTTIIKISAGWDLNPNIGIELSYSDLGKFPAPTPAFTDFDLTGTSIAVRGQIPISANLALYGKAGQIWWSADSSFFFFSRGPGPNQSGVLKFSESDTLLGLGLSFELSEQLEIELEYNSYEFEFPGQPIFSNDSSGVVVALKYEL